MLVAKAFQKPNPPRTMEEARVLSKAGYPVYVFAWDREAEFPSHEEFDGIIVHSFSLVNVRKFSRIGLALGGIIFQIALILQMVRLINCMKQRPIVHAHDINTLVPACLLRRLGLSVGLVYDCRELTYGVYSEWFHPLVGAILRTIEERCLRYADTIITVSDPIAAYLLNFSQSVNVIYNCLGLADIPNLSKREARVQLGLPLDAFIVSSIGTIRPDCRLELLVDVASRLEKENTYFLVVGDGPLAPAIRLAAGRVSQAKIAVLPRVSREKAIMYVLASDLTWAIYQNRAESLNNRLTLPWKLFESMACGVPVIVDSGTFRSKLVEEYQCGIVVESDDPDHLSQIIATFAQDRTLYHKLASASRAAATLKFNWEAMSDKIVSIYERLLIK